MMHYTETMKKYKIKKRKGFTLIEALLVMSIIAILASVVLSAVASVQTSAHETRYIAYLRSVGAAVEVSLALGAFDTYSAWEGYTVGIPYSYSAATNSCWSGFSQQADFVTRLGEAATISDCVTSPYNDSYGALLSPRGTLNEDIDGIWLFMYIDGVENVDMCDKLSWKEIWISGDNLMCGVYIRAL